MEVFNWTKKSTQYMFFTESSKLKTLDYAAALTQNPRKKIILKLGPGKSF